MHSKGEWYTKMECVRPSERWAGLQNVLCSASPLAHPDFEPSEEVSSYIHIVEPEIINIVEKYISG